VSTTIVHTVVPFGVAPTWRTLAPGLRQHLLGFIAGGPAVVTGSVIPQLSVDIFKEVEERRHEPDQHGRLLADLHLLMLCTDESVICEKAIKISARLKI